MAAEAHGVRSEAEFIVWVDEIRRGAGGEMPFVWAVMRSPWVSLHWELMHDDSLDAGFRRSLRSRFAEHGEVGRDFLLSLGTTGGNRGEAILALAKMCDPVVNGIPGREDVRGQAVRLLDEQDPTLRSAALVAIGWVGDATDISILTQRLRIEEDAECRVSAAGALTQLLIRHPSDAGRRLARDALRGVAEQEPDPSVRKAVVEALQEIAEPDKGTRSVLSVNGASSVEGVRDR